MSVEDAKPSSQGIALPDSIFMQLFKIDQTDLAWFYVLPEDLRFSVTILSVWPLPRVSPQPWLQNTRYLDSQTD